MMTTLIMAAVSSLPKAPSNGFTNPPKTNKVMITAICAIILFSFFKPELRKIKITPAKTGIRAVTEGVSEPKYPQSPRMINSMAFIRLAKYGFI